MSAKRSVMKGRDFDTFDMILYSAFIAVLPVKQLGRMLLHIL